MRFFTKDGKFRTKSGILIRMANNVFSLEVKLKSGEQEGHLYELYDEIYGAERFISLNEIHELEDLQILNVSSIWIRYLTEGAELIFTDGDGHSIHFRKFRTNTMVGVEYERTI